MIKRMPDAEVSGGAGGESGGTLNRTVKITVTCPKEPLVGLDELDRQLGETLNRIKDVEASLQRMLSAKGSISLTANIDQGSLTQLQTMVSTAVAEGIQNAKIAGGGLGKQTASNAGGLNSPIQTPKGMNETSIKATQVDGITTSVTKTFQDLENKSVSLIQKVVKDGENSSKSINTIIDKSSGDLIKSAETQEKAAERYSIAKSKAESALVAKKEKDDASYVKWWDKVTNKQERNEKANKLRELRATRQTDKDLAARHNSESALTRQKEKEDASYVNWWKNTLNKRDKEERLTSKAENPLTKPSNSRDFLTNATHVTQWASSVALLYKSLDLARYSLVSLINVGRQTARLEQVFSKIGGSAKDLRNDVMGLASAYGRSAQEAMESAIAFSRMGLNRKAINEGVRVSLMAANVAELSVAESTDYLTSIMQQYNMSVLNLQGVLAGLNEISNKYNVTNADMLQGISRTAAVAAQAGLPLSELMGIIGGVVGQTKQSGANIGNSLKSIITALGNPAIQDLLRSFSIEVKAGSGEEMKNFSQILNELYLQYNKMISAEQKWLIYKVAGKTQSTRMQAMLDSYITGQRLAIQSQLNMNSAESENALIMQTLSAQLQSLSSEWERFVNIQGNRGGVQVLQFFVTTFKDLIAVFNNGIFSKGATVILALFAAMAARLALTSIQMAASGQKAGFLANSLTGMKNAWQGVADALNNAHKAFVKLHPVIGWPLKQLDQMGRGLDKVAQKVEKFGKSKVDGIAEMQRMYAVYNGKSEMAKLKSYLVMDPAEYKKERDAIVAKTKKEYINAGPTFAQRGIAGVSNVAATGISMAGGAVKLGSQAISSTTSMAGGMLLATVAAWGVGKAISAVANATGQSISNLTDELDSLALASETASKRADALANTVRLINTISTQLENPKVSAENKDEMRKELKYLLTPQEIKSWESAPNEKEFLSKLKDAKDLESYKSLARAQALDNEEMDKAQARLKELQNGPLASLEAIRQTESKIEEIQQQKNKHKQQEIALSDQVRQQSMEHLRLLAKEKAEMDDIAELFSESPTSKSPVKGQQLRAEAATIQKQIDSNKLIEITNSERETEKNKKIAEIEERKKKLLDIININSASNYSSNEFINTDRSEAIIKARDQIKLLDTEIEGVKKQYAPVQHMTPEEVGAKEKEYRDKIARADIEDVFPREKNIAWIAKQYAKANVDSTYVGVNTMEKMINRNDALDEFISKTRIKTQLGRPEDRLSASAQMQAYLVEKEKTYNEMRMHGLEIEKEINQMWADRGKLIRESIFGAGPAKMLQLMAASQVSQKGMSMGRFLAMDPSMRESIGLFNPNFTPKGMELGIEKNMYQEMFGNTTKLSEFAVQNQVKMSEELWARQLEAAKSINAAAAKFDLSTQMLLNGIMTLFGGGVGPSSSAQRLATGIAIGLKGS